MKTHRLALSPLLLSAALAIAWLPSLGAAEADASGTWTWTRAGRDGTEQTTTLKLKAEGEKLTGTVSGRNNNETAISKGSVKGDEIRFEVTREFNGNSMTARYHGKIEGNSLKGTIETTRNGQERSREWTATRLPGLDGSWKYSFTTQNGNTMEPVLALKVNGEKVAGTLKVNDFERPVEGTYKNGKAALTITAERNGQTWTTRIDAEVKGDKLVGRSTSNWGGNERVRDLEATRVKE